MLKRNTIALFSVAAVALLGACDDDAFTDACDDGACSGGDLFAACFQSGQVLAFDLEAMERGDSFSGVDGPQSLAALGDDYVVVVGALDGSFTVFDRHDMSRVGGIILEDSRALDLVVIRGDTAYVVASYTNEVVWVDVSDPTSPELVRSVSTGEGSNPMGITVDDEGTVWVTLYFADGVMAIHEDGGTETFELPEVEGRALPAGITAIGEKIYVSLNNLDESWAPAGNGKLVELDAMSHETRLIDLGPTCTNAGHVAASGSRLFVPCAGTYGEDDGAVAVFDTESEELHVIPTGGAPSRLSVSGDVVFVADSADIDLIRIDLGLDAMITRHEACAEEEWEFVGDVLAFP